MPEPTPPVAANKKVDSAAQSCPLKAKKQCELKKLKVKATFTSTSEAKPIGKGKNPVESSAVVTQLEAKKRRRRERIPPAVQKQVGARVVELLSQYDLVIEEIAGFPSKGNEEIADKAKPGEPRSPHAVAKETAGPANTAAIEVEAELEGTCPHADHVRLMMKVANATPMLVEVDPPPIKGEEKMKLEDATWDAGKAKVEIKEIVAPTFKADIAGGDSAFAAIFRLIMWVWNANKSMDIELRAEACGVHSATELGIHDLNALVRVYRDISVAAGIKVPPVKQVTMTSERTIGIGTDGAADKITATNHETGRKGTLSAEENESGFKGTLVFEKVPKDEFSFYFKFNELELLLRETYDKTKEQAEALDEARKKAQEKYKDWKDERAKKAAEEKATMDAWAAFLTFRDRLQIFFNDFVGKVRAIVKAITSVLDLMKKAPQLGFKLTVDIGFLSGDVFLGWAHSPADSTAAMSWPLADRYAPLLHKFHLESKVSLITFKVEGSFGFMLDAGPIGKAEARVAVSLSLEIFWTTMIDAILFSGASNGKNADVLTQDLGGKTTGNLRATVEVKVAFWSLKKEIGIESGIQVDGKIEWSLMKDEIKYTLSVNSLETGWYFYSTDIKTGQANVSRHTIIEAKQLMPPIQRTEKI